MLRYCRGKLMTPDPHNTRCEHNLLKCPNCGQTGCTNPNCTRHNFQGTVCQSCFNHNADYHDPEHPQREPNSKIIDFTAHKSSNQSTLKELDNGVCNMLGPFSVLIKLLLEILNVIFTGVLNLLRRIK